MSAPIPYAATSASTHPATPAVPTGTSAVPPTPPGAESVRGRCVVFLHAHPDDEAIFTAATMHRLARQGARVVLVTATAGELGPALRPLPAGRSLAEVRRAELERACAALGVARLVLLGRRDSGMPGWADNAHPDALAAADLPALARRLADLCAAEGAEALVHYDRGGIYGHPDHVAVHRLGAAAARLAGVADYQATVDRSRVRTGRHLVGPAHAGVTEAYARPDPATGPVPLGAARAEVTTTVVAGPADLAAKRAAMSAHASQIDGAAVRHRGFARTYGQEWYVRSGRTGLLDLPGIAS